MTMTMTNAFREETWHDQQKYNDDNNDKKDNEDNGAERTPWKSDPRDLWSLGHWSHLWKLRTTIIKFIATLIKSDGAAFAILAMFSLKKEGWVSWISFIDCLHIPQRSQYDVKYGVYLRPPPNLEDDYELSDLHRFAQNIGKKKYLHRKAEKEVTNQLDDIDIDPTSDINSRDIVEKEAQLGVGDTFWLFIFTLNRAKKWFNSIFNSKLNRRYSSGK